MIYFIQEKHDKEFVKIGVTSLRLDRRLMCLQVGNPRELEIALVLKGMYDLEGKLHDYFHAEHVRGEWFQVSERLKAYMNKPYDLTLKPQPTRPSRKWSKSMFQWD